MTIDLGLVNGEVWAAEHVDALEDAINDAQASADVAAAAVGDRHAIRVLRSTNQVIPHNVLTAFQFTVIDYDDGVFDGIMAVPAVAVPIPSGGTFLYLVSARLTGPAGWAADDTNYAAAIFNTSSAEDYPMPRGPALGANPRGPMWHAVTSINDVATIAVVITQVTGSDKTFTAAELTITRLSE